MERFGHWSRSAAQEECRMRQVLITEEEASPKEELIAEDQALQPEALGKTRRLAVSKQRAEA